MGVGKVPSESVKGAVIEPGRQKWRQTWQPCKLHPAGTITLKTSVEKCADIYHKNIQRKMRAGKKSSEIHCRWKEHSGSEMIDLSESAVKL